ncbi:MAG: isoprenylcysteine carboxylmethyltransferase family protein [Actinomycetota bacterium]
MRRLLPPHLVLLLVTGAAALTALAPVGTAVPGRWRLLGLVPLVAGVVVTVGGARHFDRVGTNIRTFDDPGHLVDDGLFARSRNPMYLGFVLLLTGVAALLGSVVAWLAPIAFVLAADRWYIPFEERRMAARFGSAFFRYRERVPRWIGRRREVADAGHR